MQTKRRHPTSAASKPLARAIPGSDSETEEFPRGTVAANPDSDEEASDDEGEEDVYSADEADLPHIFLDSDAEESEADAPTTPVHALEGGDSSSEEAVTDASDDGEEEEDDDSSVVDSLLASSSGDEDDEDQTKVGGDSRPRTPKFDRANMSPSHWTAYVQERKIHPEIEADYDSDSSTEAPTNTVGNVPMEWYDDLPHIGYDINGKRILRPATKDELDRFLANFDDPDGLVSVPDRLAQQDVKLSDHELEIIKRLQKAAYPDEEYDPYEDTVEWFTSDVSVAARPQPTVPKRRFLPSLGEARRINKLVHAIRSGRIVLNKKPAAAPRYYQLWSNNPDEAGEAVRGIHKHLPAPRMALPGHALSYHPPQEYIPTAEELAAMPEEDKDKTFMANLPRDYGCLRRVPAYGQFIRERFQRCLDLYLCPRASKRPDPTMESLLPKLPDPKDLRPFPTTLSLTYTGHTARIRTLAVDPTGLWLLSGADDGTVRLWEVSTGRCAKVWQLGTVVHSVAWNPHRELCLFAVAVDDRVLLVAPPEYTVCSDAISTVTREFVLHSRAEDEEDSEEEKNEEDEAREEEGAEKEHDPESAGKLVTWAVPTTRQRADHILAVIRHRRTVRQVVWHRKGDHFATVSPLTAATQVSSGSSVLIHLLSKRRTQQPFQTTHGAVQQVLFHPQRPHFILATQRQVRIYDLMKQKAVKTLYPRAKWISSIDIHPGGDNVLVGTYDRKLCWFDLDLSSAPYKSIRFHQQAIRQVAYHPRFPLFASAADDCTLQVFHGMVYQDLLKNPLIVPVKILRGHKPQGPLGVLGCQFHPLQPWLFSCGADATIRLWT
ncbi:Ribosome biogenesis protein erb1 [Tieghemiomyces parasiticus]|uniref:Ribosome biogenesis protein ERB1 n=1 Tax=Tieghemiomyces parasiticus TaxID=78921 RepID=A0A9W8AH21_9FUNG|nr:Ribosome biogenesis protein erb1 [Tieghemiomyces parasiticus]